MKTSQINRASDIFHNISHVQVSHVQTEQGHPDILEENLVNSFTGSQLITTHAIGRRGCVAHTMG
jgi:serine acetyltransferase